MQRVISNTTRSSSLIYLIKLYINSDNYCVFVVRVMKLTERSLTENDDGNVGQWKIVYS
jgi:hypothetical protein